jgi:hypothetical protein
VPPGGFLAAFTSTLAATIRYSMVTFSPFFSSPVTLVSAVRAISHVSVPFWTVMVSAVSSSTGPVTW